jgi:sugar phosphate isomerase/epimerase
LGVSGVQFDAVGELSPDELSQTGRRHLKHLLQTYRLEVVAIGCPTRRGYDVLERLENRIAQANKTLLMASQLGAPAVINTVGPIPEDRFESKTLHFFDALSRIGAEALRVGPRFAIETGPESPANLAKFLAEMNCYGLAVNYDPANLLARGHDPYEGAALLGANIVGLHVKDVVRTGTTVSGFKEVPVGRGELNFDRLFAAMFEIDYVGYWTLERETAGRGEAEFAEAIAFLSRF